MALDPKDVGELQKALNDAAGKASALWITFITFELYVAIAFGSVSHRDLFLETAIKLPVLNVELPLVGFFVVAPTVLVIFHFYIFLQLLALARKAMDYDALLRLAAPGPSDRQYLRQRLDPFLVLQFLAGPREQRTGFAGFSLRAIAWLTLVGVPLLILLQGLVTFLPYHREWVTWLQRLAVFVDLAVIWYFWNRVRNQDASFLTPVPTRVWHYGGAAATALVVIFTANLATFPGELLHEQLPSIRFVPASIVYDSGGQPARWRVGWTSPHEMLFAGTVDEVHGRPRSLFSNRLVLPNQDFVDDELLARVIARQPKRQALWQGERTRSLRGRDLRGAILIGADLRRVDFTGAKLDGANLTRASLEGALFGCARTGAEDNMGYREPLMALRTRRPDPQGCTWLRGAVLNEARLQGASLDFAELQGAVLDFARADGASLNGAQLQGASLRVTELAGASLLHTSLQGASLSSTHLYGAQLNFASLQGAELHQARFHGASLDDAKLHGTTFSSPEFIGASLARAEFLGAATPSGRFAGADLTRSELWGAGPPLESDLQLTDLSDIRIDRPGKTASDLVEAALVGVIGAYARQRVAGSVRGVEARALVPDAPYHAKAWKQLAARQQPAAIYRAELASFLAELGCGEQGAPHVARGLLTNGRVKATGHHAAAIERRWRDGAGCPGASELNEIDRQKLRQIVDETQRELAGRIVERICDVDYGPLAVAVLIGGSAAESAQYAAEIRSAWARVAELMRSDRYDELKEAEIGVTHAQMEMHWDGRIEDAGPYGPDIEAALLAGKNCPGAPVLTEDDQRTLRRLVEPRRRPQLAH